MTILKYRRNCKIQGKNLSGFTLVEVLVCFILIAVGCLALTRLQSTSMGGGSLADNLTAASFLAETQLERMRCLNFDELNSRPGTLEETITREGLECAKGSAGCNFTRTTTITPRKPTSRSTMVTVRMNWVDALGPRSLVYEASVSNISF
ncbi:hypothetical protein C4J81_00745 [Deltaproteobacteria bacterium Smac51]|nr:hypothetical protein C4J81_00745 [Deltaproteobacteria bacterium Smac51]